MILPLSIIPTLLLLAFGLRTNASPILSLSVEARADSVPVSNEPRGLPLRPKTFMGFAYALTTTEDTLRALVSDTAFGGNFEIRMKRADKKTFKSPGTWKECSIYSSNINEQGIKKVLVEPAESFAHYTKEMKNKYLSDNHHTPSETVLLLSGYKEGMIVIPKELALDRNPLALSVGDCMTLDKITGTGDQVHWESWDYVKMTGPKS